MGAEVGELWHVLAVGLPLDFAPTLRNESGPQLAQRAREAGPFVAIAHPAWSQLTLGDGRALSAAHAVEVYNHGSAVENDRGDGFYLLDALCNEGRKITAIATDDAHLRNGDHDAFGGFVEVMAESARDLASVTEGGEILREPRAANFRRGCKSTRGDGRMLASQRHRASHWHVAGDLADWPSIDERHA